MGYYPYSYEQVAGWVSTARSYVCDVSNGMNSKATNQALLSKTLELLDLLKQAFKDSEGVLRSPEFRINAEEDIADTADKEELCITAKDILNACPDEKDLDVADAKELAAAKAGMAIAEAQLGEKSKYAKIPDMKAN